MIDTLLLAGTPGSGVLARLPGIVVFAAPSADDAGVHRLLEICKEAAGSSSAPGPVLASDLIGLTRLGSSAPEFCTLADAGDGLSVLVHGAVDVALIVDGNEVVLSGRHSLTWVDRIIEGRVDHVRGGPSLELPSSRTSDDDQIVDDNVVAAGGFVLRRDASRATPSSATDETAEVSAVSQPVQADFPRGAADLGDASQFKSVLLTEAASEPARAPLPLASEVIASSVPADGVVVQGIECSRGHFTDPANLYCGVCGISMAQRTQVLVEGIRPSLGFLVFDDATTFSLDADYVVGREPYGDARVEAGSARPLPLDDAASAVSRVHADVRLDGWTVLVADRGSTNGTFVWEETHRQWRRVGTHAERIRPGTRVAFGQRTATFESPHDHRHT